MEGLRANRGVQVRILGALPGFGWLSASAAGRRLAEAETADVMVWHAGAGVGEVRKEWMARPMTAGGGREYIRARAATKGPGQKRSTPAAFGGRRNVNYAKIASPSPVGISSFFVHRNHWPGFE